MNPDQQHILGIIHDHDAEPLEYTERKTAKAVVVGDDGKILMFSSTLLGGGVEEGESFEEALHRELMEEAGIEAEIIKYLGTIIGYRDSSKRRYVIQGYLCKYLRTVSAPTSADANELELEVTWHEPKETIPRLQSEIAALKEAGPGDDTHRHQSRIHNRQMALRFIQEAVQNM